MNPIERAADKAREQAASLQREAAAYESLATVKPLADLASDFIHLSRDAIWIRVPVDSRAKAAAAFEALAAQLPPLPVVATRGTFASVKPACDYQAKDGEIVLDADSALPCYFHVDGFGADRGATKESLIAWFETPADRVRVEWEIRPALARCQSVAVKDDRRRVIHENWEWRGLPHSNMSFAFNGGSRSTPNSFSFLFDVSLDVAGWLAGSNNRDIRKS